MTVTDVLEYLAGGMTQEELLKEFPDLTSEEIRACLAFAADRERTLDALPLAKELVAEFGGNPQNECHQAKAAKIGDE